MRFKHTLQRVKKQVDVAVHRGMDQARKTDDDEGAMLRSRRLDGSTSMQSSHPDADIGLVPSEAAIDVPTQADFSTGSNDNRRKAIVSIRGQDVDEDKLKDKEAA